jgi:hypothetical protein
MDALALAAGAFVVQGPLAKDARRGDNKAAIRFGMGG